nr:hypothetical protein [Tanacetum cinerariifolium]
RFGHQTRDCRTLVFKAKQSSSVAKEKAKVTCYECGILGHFKSDCPSERVPEMMTTVNHGMSIEEIKRVVAQRVANAIEANDIYDTKTNLARKSMSQTERQKEKVAKNASNKRKWEGVLQMPILVTSKKALEQVRRLHAMNVGTKGTTGEIVQSKRTKTMKTNIQKGTGASQKATCYECRNQGHYRRDCMEQKNQNHENQIKSTKAGGVVHAFGGGETEQDLNNIEDEIEA